VTYVLWRSGLRGPLYLSSAPTLFHPLSDPFLVAALVEFLTVAANFHVVNDGQQFADLLTVQFGRCPEGASRTFVLLPLFPPFFSELSLALHAIGHLQGPPPFPLAQPPPNTDLPLALFFFSLFPPVVFDYIAILLGVRMLNYLVIIPSDLSPVFAE